MKMINKAMTFLQPPLALKSCLKAASYLKYSFQHIFLLISVQIYSEEPKCIESSVDSGDLEMFLQSYERRLKCIIKYH